MTRFLVAPAAQADIEAIIAKVADEDPRTAEKFLDEVYRAFEFLADNPDAGHKRPDLTDRPVLFWTVMRAFAVIYRKRMAKPLEIVRVVRWRRDIAALTIDWPG